MLDVDLVDVFLCFSFVNSITEKKGQIVRVDKEKYLNSINVSKFINDPLNNSFLHLLEFSYTRGFHSCRIFMEIKDSRFDNYREFTSFQLPKNHLCLGTNRAGVMI